MYTQFPAKETFY